MRHLSQCFGIGVRHRVLYRDTAGVAERALRGGQLRIEQQDFVPVALQFSRNKDSYYTCTDNGDLVTHSRSPLIGVEFY